MGLTNENKNEFSLNILEIVVKQQDEYGLRTNNYFRYMKYCSSRLHRIRKSLNITLGKGVYKNRVLDPKKFNDIRYLHIPLLNYL